MERDDLERLVDEYNRSATSPLTLPARYAFGDSLHSLDVRVSRTIAIGPRLRVTLIGDAFNLYNASNLTEYSGDLTTPAFGQPGSRIRQAFGSAGPRAFQLAANVSF
jgi:hypothetical protein